MLGPLANRNRKLTDTEVIFDSNQKKKSILSLDRIHILLVFFQQRRWDVQCPGFWLRLGYMICWEFYISFSFVFYRDTFTRSPLFFFNFNILILSTMLSCFLLCFIISFFLSTFTTRTRAYRYIYIEPHVCTQVPFYTHVLYRHVWSLPVSFTLIARCSVRRPQRVSGQFLSRRIFLWYFENAPKRKEKKQHQYKYSPQKNKKTQTWRG